MYVVARYRQCDMSGCTMCAEVSGCSDHCFEEGNCQVLEGCQRRNIPSITNFSLPRACCEDVTQKLEIDEHGVRKAHGIIQRGNVIGKVALEF